MERERCLDATLGFLKATPGHAISRKLFPLTVLTVT